MADLVVLATEAQGSHYSLHQQHATVIGRKAYCDVVLPRGTVSRKHARVFFENGQFRIEDLGSSNGTFLNGRRVDAPSTLNDGDRINISDIPLAFCISEESQLAETSKFDLGTTGGVTLTPIPPTTDRLDGASAFFSVRLRNLLEITRQLGSGLTVDEKFPRVLDILFYMFPQAFLGEIQLADSAGRLLPVAIKHGRDDDSSVVTRVPVGSELSKQVLMLGQPLLKSCVSRTNESVLADNDLSMICVPVLGPSHARLGTILLEADDDNRGFTDEDLELVAAVGILTGQAVEYARNHQALLRLDQTQRQLETARQIQFRMLPRTRPNVPGYSFYEHYAPADAVGGDFYFFDSLPDSRVFMGVADACGKALPAALMIAQFATEVRHCLATARTLKLAMSSLNHFVCDLAEGFITFCLCLLDANHHTLTVVNAGHMSPLCRRRKSGEVESLTNKHGSFPLGIAANEQFHPTTVSLEPGDQVLLYTDGITEAMAPDNSLYGTARLQKLMASPREDVKSRLDAIVAEVVRFRAGRRPSDDSCLLGFARTDG